MLYSYAPVKSVFSVEFLPKHYVAVRKDRAMYNGCIMINVRGGLIVDEDPTQGSAEEL